MCDERAKRNGYTGVDVTGTFETNVYICAILCVPVSKQLNSVLLYGVEYGVPFEIRERIYLFSKTLKGRAQQPDMHAHACMHYLHEDPPNPKGNGHDRGTSLKSFYYASFKCIIIRRFTVK